ncbi:MAG TPA: polyphenol oxidase family protein, partial [Thermoanaerobacterales bacterium]|nr:polyphenol oxidase family protein [Thermoanaerobacterales bacterium]
HLDLWEANFLQLVEKGVRKENISLSGICTSCNNEISFSHRKEKGRTGRFAAIIQLL